MWRTQCVLALIALYFGLVQSWDFATTKGDLLEFYTNDTILESVRFDSQNLTALIYNEVHNMMLYVNKQSGNDTICSYDISSKENKCYTERSGRNIHGLAFDPVTEKLFFTDTTERSINWISLEHGSNNNVFRNPLIKFAAGIPTDLAVDSCRGYVYWINTNLTPPTIERARFDGSERKVVITSVSIGSTYKAEPVGLAIDQQIQKIYWMEPNCRSEYSILYADLDGKNKTLLNKIGHPGDFGLSSKFLNTLSVSKTDLYVMSSCPHPSCNKVVFKIAKSVPDKNHQHAQFILRPDVTLGIATNYKIEDKLPEFQDCEPLTRLIRNKSDGPFCVHGTKVNGQSLCKCTPGYIGERCDVSVCNNYCMQGNCSSNDAGLPKCRCNAGYSGDRCEVYACSGYCLNNGDCALNENSEPVCECKEDYVGDRCEISHCLNYCIQGNCSLNDEGLPGCRCDAGYSGDRCEVDSCHRYCLNNGVCSLNEAEEPFCQCGDNLKGPRCEDVQNISFTFTNTPTYSEDTNQTLADVLSNWRKPSAKIFVFVKEESD